MKPHSLIDLYVPASVGSPEEVAEAAARAHLDAVVYVAHHADELPDPEVVAALAARSDLPRLHPAVAALGNGYRFVVLLPEWDSEAVYDALEVLDSPEAIQATVAQAGGCALPVSPRQAPDGEVMRSAPRLAEAPPVGVVCVVDGGSALGRDLDVEDTASGGRRVLGGSGPFASLETVGRFASVLPAPADDLVAVIAALAKGLGAAVELLAPTEGKKRKRKRRRNRKRGPRQDGGGAPPVADSGSEAKG